MANLTAWLSQLDENLLPPESSTVIWPRPDRSHIADFATFSGPEQLPPDLEAFVELIKEDSTGRGIITEVDRINLKITAARQPKNADALSNLIKSPCAVDTKGKRKQLGDLAPIGTLLGIVEAARICQEKGCDKSQWNRDVHARLWSAALDHAAVNRNGILRYKSDVDVDLMHVEGEHLRVPHIAVLEKIQRNWRADFCLCTRPRDEIMDEAVQELCDDVFTVSNTKRWGLLRRPLSVCMITKTCDDSWTDSLYEIGIWFSAQWTIVEDIESTLLESAPAVSSGFLPGIIVLGHTWYFVAATQGPMRDDRSRKPVVWSNLVIGTTADVEGIAKIFTTLQRLASWSAFDHWLHVRRIVEELLQSEADES